MTDTSYAFLTTFRPYVRECGDHRRPAWRYGPRRLLDYLLVYIEDGAGRFEIDGVAYDARPGDLFWIKPNVVNLLEGFEPSMLCPYAHFDLIYRAGLSEKAFSTRQGTLDLKPYGKVLHPDMSGTPFGRLGAKLEAHNNRRVGALLRELCAEAKRAQPYAQLAAGGLMLRILAEILRGQEPATQESRAHAPSLEEAEVYLRERCAEALRVEDVASLCGLSPAHFRRLFANRFGCSPRAHLRRARIALAKEFMLNSDLRMKEIAARTGFANVHNLSRAFRDEEGLSPTAYRSFGAASMRVEGRRAHRHRDDG
ncbi:MAG: AraC family transcriptional regulator [Planctomycetota bacterium]|nr:AraC family transcriptional regulator [Planctomycetota bacterium]